MPTKNKTWRIKSKSIKNLQYANIWFILILVNNLFLVDKCLNV